MGTPRRCLLLVAVISAIAPPACGQAPVWLALDPPFLFGQAAVTDTHRDRLVVFGGADANVETDATWERAAGLWCRRVPPTSPPARREHTMAFDAARGVAVLFGGSQTGVELGDCWLYDGADWVQVSSAAMPPARSGAAMAFDAARGRCVLFGGFRQGAVYADTWEWDGAVWTLRAPAHAPTARYGHALAWSPPDAHVLLFGGNDTAGRPPSLRNDTWTWNGSDWLLQAPAHAPPPRYRHAAAGDPVRVRVVLCGGDGGTELADAWQWDGADWHAAAPLPVPRQLTAAAWSPHDAAVLALGGAQNVFNGWVPAPVPLTDGPQAFDGAVWRGLQPGVLEGASYDPGRGEFVGLANWTNALWRWNGELWRQETVVPPWASTADIAFDSVRQRLVFVTGTGYTTGGHAETWEYANGIWTLPPATTPRPYVELVFDAARGQTLCPSPFGTLAWQGAGWATAPVTVPPHNLGLLFDPGRGSVLAVGTSSLGATEIWQWNGSAWSLLHASNTGPTGSGRTVVDQVRNRVVTHVSSTGVSWEWDGTAWAPIASMAPYLRRGSLVHDARRQQTVLVTDRTWVLSRAPAAAVAYGSACGAAAPRLIAFGAPRVGRHDFAVDVHAAANAATPVFVAFSVLPGSRPLPGGCTLLLANVDALGFVQTDASGFASVRLPLPDDVAARGATVFLQAGVLGGGVLSTSAGLRLLLGD